MPIEYTISDVIREAGYYSTCVSAGFLSISVVFFVSKFIAHDKQFSSPYFHIYCLGLIINIVTVLSMIYNTIYSFTSVSYLIYDTVNWYSRLFLGAWNSLLVVNRCTAILKPISYAEYWSSWRYCLIIILLLLYPGIVNINSFFNLSCRINELFEGCASYATDNQMLSLISNIVNSGFSLFLSVYTCFYIHCKSTGITVLQNAKYERRLLFQATFNSAVFVVYAIFNIKEQSAESIYDIDNYFLYKGLSDLVLAGYYLTSNLLLFLSR